MTSPTNQVGTLKIDVSRQKKARQTQQQQIEEPNESNSSRASKHEHQVLNIDLTLGSNNSMSKRPNLFNEKSTSRERILTKQKTFQPNQKQRNPDIISSKTPSFNMTPGLKYSEESKEEEYPEED